MDPVSLTIGIVPLLGGSIKLFRASQSKFRAFRHYSREVDRIRKQFERQRQFFLNEIHLALRLVLDDDELLIRQMVGDGEHPKWHDTEGLEAVLIDRFHANNYQVLNEIIDEIGKTITAIQEGLECFSCLEEARYEGEPIKDAVKRLRDKVRIAFDKSKFSQLISDLRSSNNDLRLLREQAAELCKSDPELLKIATAPATTQSVTQRRLPPEFGSYSTTRKAAQALYDALWAAWSTQDAAHFRHWAKLFLETRTEDGVYLNLILSCIRQDLIQPLPTIFKLHVQSQLLDWASSQPPASPEIPNPKRRRVVRFAENNDQAVSKKDTPNTPDLRCSQHLCSELHFSKALPTCTEAVGYLDTCAQDSFRHSFYHCRQSLCDPVLCSGVGSRKLTCTHGKSAESADMSDVQPTRLDQLLSLPRNEELSVPDQLQLALRIAAAVLKFNSTSWLSEYWGLQDLYLFEDGPDLPTSLQTLHLGVEWSSECHTAIDATPDKTPNQAVEEAKLIHGIHNTTLYNLGVALLSIGRWAPVDPHDVLAVRRMALQASPLGPKFQHMTQRVLDCDFGCGKDLAKSRLQKAVYDGVLIELESMISALSIQSSQ